MRPNEQGERAAFPYHSQSFGKNAVTSSVGPTVDALETWSAGLSEFPVRVKVASAVFDVGPPRVT